MLELALTPRQHAEITDPAEQQLGELAAFDHSLAAKIHSLEVAYLMGQSFGKPAHAEEFPLDPLDPNDKPPFSGLAEAIDSHRWAMALAAFPYRHHRNQGAIRNRALLAFFEAINSYDYSASTPFISHLSEVVVQRLAEAYGPSYDLWLPKPAEFPEFVHRQRAKQWGELPAKRTINSFEVGEKVFVLKSGRLVAGRVKKLTERQPGPDQSVRLNFIPEDELPAVTERLAHEGGLAFELRDEAAGLDEAREAEGFVKVPEKVTDQVVQQMHALGRLPLWVYARYPQLTLGRGGGSDTVIIESDSSVSGEEPNAAQVIPLTALRGIISSPLFREIYLESLERQGNGSREELIEAFLQLGQADGEVSISPAAERRARPHRDDKRRARSSAQRYYGNGV